MTRSRLRSRLPEIAARLGPRVDDAVKEVAEKIADDARARVPVGRRQPHLKDSIRVVPVGDQTGRYAVVAGDKETFYGHFVEFGTSHSPPHPFLVPALEANRDEARKVGRRLLEGL